MKDLSEEVRITVWPKFANSPILTAFKRLRITTNVSNVHAEAAKAAEEGKKKIVEDAKKKAAEDAKKKAEADEAKKKVADDAKKKAAEAPDS